MPAPYITPQILDEAPTGIAWNTIPAPGASAQQQAAAKLTICRRATGMVDAACNQILCATTDTEELLGPDYRLTVHHNYARALLSRFPVISVLSARVSASASLPPVWMPVPPSALALETAGLDLASGGVYAGAGAGPAAIVIAAGYVTWALGRNGYRLSVTYTNGWPNTLLTAPAAQGATTISVDETTGWLGTRGTLYDGQSTEDAVVTAVSAAAGPGTLTLTAASGYAHNLGVLFSALPPAVQQAAVLFATEQALVRGSTATAIQSLPGARTGGGGPGRQDLRDEANDWLRPFKRVI